MYTLYILLTIEVIFIFAEGTYLPEQYHIAIECILFVFWEVLILKKPTQIIYQPLSYIARLINLIAEKRQNQCPYLTNT
jgi:hypothetical protein